MMLADSSFQTLIAKSFSSTMSTHADHILHSPKSFPFETIVSTKFKGTNETKRDEEKRKNSCFEHFSCHQLASVFYKYDDPGELSNRLGGQLTCGTGPWGEYIKCPVRILHKGCLLNRVRALYPTHIAHLDPLESQESLSPQNLQETQAYFQKCHGHGNSYHLYDLKEARKYESLV